MRKVEVFGVRTKETPETTAGPKSYTTEQYSLGYAEFHRFGLDFEEFDRGFRAYSVAIVEFPDGRVSGVPLHLIRFVE